MVLRLSKPLAASPQRARGFLPTFARPAGGGEASRLAQSSSGRLSIAILPALLGFPCSRGPLPRNRLKFPHAQRPGHPQPVSIVSVRNANAGRSQRHATRRRPWSRGESANRWPRLRRTKTANPTQGRQTTRRRPARLRRRLHRSHPPPLRTAPAAQAWSQAEIIEALQSCLKALGPVVAEIEAQAPLRAGDCGVAAPVALAAVGAHPRVEMRPPPMLNCAVAAASPAGWRTSCSRQRASCSARPSSRC